MSETTGFVRPTTTQNTSWGRGQCVHCKNKESQTKHGNPVCKVTGMVMTYVYKNCSYRKVD
jgi:hypothetical protein